jgi:hypothetical protein
MVFTRNVTTVASLRSRARERASRRVTTGATGPTALREGRRPVRAETTGHVGVAPRLDGRRNGRPLLAAMRPRARAQGQGSPRWANG